MFIRLIVSQVDPQSGLSKGVFVAAHDLLDSGKMSGYEKTNLNSILQWFTQNLPEPKKKFPGETIFWYKSDQLDLVKKTWELAHTLNNSGIEVQTIKTDKPGYIVYEDEYQVGAVPFKDTIT